MKQNTSTAAAPQLELTDEEDNAPATSTAVESFKVGQLELPVLGQTAGFGIHSGKPSKKGLKATTLMLTPLRSKTQDDLADETGLKGAELKAKGRVYADAVMDWQLTALTKLVTSGEWTAARRACRVSGNGKGITFALTKVAAKVQPMSTDDMLARLGISAQQLAIAKSIKLSEPVAVASK